jgi:hypothetical protein
MHVAVVNVAWPQDTELDGLVARMLVTTETTTMANRSPNTVQPHLLTVHLSKTRNILAILSTATKDTTDNKAVLSCSHRRMPISLRVEVTQCMLHPKDHHQLEREATARTASSDKC